MFFTSETPSLSIAVGILLPLFPFPIWICKLIVANLIGYFPIIVIFGCDLRSEHPLSTTLFSCQLRLTKLNKEL